MTRRPTDATDNPTVHDRRPSILLTGATGYVGGRLLDALHNRGHTVRCIARRPANLRQRVSRGIDVRRGDVLDKEALISALDGVDTAFYLVHSMGSTRDFETLDRDGARNFAEAAKTCGVRRIIYLGGLGDSDEPLSRHLRSRHEVGEILRSSGVQVIELRASIVIGSGSLSFELIRALTERLPVMTTPKWVSVPAQPIGISDLLEYLMRSIDLPVEGNRTFEIGGRDVLSYGDLIRVYAGLRGLRRVLIPVPVLTPWLSSRWLGLVTPVYARIGRRLIDSLRHPTVVRDPSAERLFDIEPTPVRDAMASALKNEDRDYAATRWSDALSSGDTLKDWGGVRFGNRLVDSRTVTVGARPEHVFRVISRIGGRTGWYYATWLWRVRGFLDLLVGGIGLRRGRRDPDRLRVGDVVDWWRVEDVVPNQRVRFESEMKTPGRAWLEFELSPGVNGGTTIRQTAIFDPVGLLGLVYWYALYAMHEIVFAGMLDGIARRSHE